MSLRTPFLLALLLPLAFAWAAPAVIIDSGDGTGNTSAPAPDPGWDYVGSCNGLTCVYLGHGWVLTANHVGAGDAYFGNVLYPWQIGSDVQLRNPDNSYADLRLFHLQPPFPALPDIAIASTTASSSVIHPLYLIGNGRNRGAPTTWNPPGPGPTYDGYLWGPGTAKRWGTNLVEVPQTFIIDLGTWVFGTVFDQSGSGHTTHECEAAVGDSGGAAFAWNVSAYELAGILIAIGRFQDQPAETALYDNETYAADLSIYRDEIVTTMPEPAGGLRAGVALLALLASAGTRRACRGTARAASSPPRA
jgi:hypothetical protein